MRFSLLHGEAPSQEEIEAWHENEAQTLLIIKARWVFLGMMLGYGLLVWITLAAFGLAYSFSQHILPPAVALLVLIAYNSWYHYSYRWFSHIRFLSQAQLIMDACYILLLIHLTEGALSWVWVMYPLLIVEAAIIIDQRRTVFLIAGFCTFMHGALLVAERWQLLPIYHTPFFPQGLPHSAIYDLVFWLWAGFINFYFAFVGVYLVGVIRRNEQKCRAQAITNSLTGLYNRAHFFQSLDNELARCQRYSRIVSVLIVDIDYFKQFNDRFGHLEGDRLLQGVADVLKKNVRSIDMACRYGGDEFGIILPETPGQGGEDVAERLRRKIQEKGALLIAERLRRQVEKLGMGVTISVGVATYPIHGDSSEKLLQASDTALYKAKHMGRNRVVVATSNA